MGVRLGWRSGSRPRLEGRWLCRKDCLRQAIGERARRDFPDTAPTPSRLRHRVPLGLILQARGVLTAQELQRALHLQAVHGGRLGTVLVEQIGVPEDRIAAAVAAQWGLPVLHLSSPAAAPLRSIAPLRLFHSGGCLPVERTPTRLVLACAEGPDPALALALERMHPVRVDFGVVPSTVLETWRGADWQSAIPVQRVVCRSRDHMVAEAAELIHRLQPVDCRAVRVGSFWWLRIWLEDAARQEEQSDDMRDVLFTIAPRDAEQRLPSLSSL